MFDLGEAIKSVYNWGEGAAKDVYGLFTDPHPHAFNAHNWYSFGMELPMYMDASELDMSGITQKDLTPTNKKDIYTLNFFNVQGGAKRYTHTDITLGEITLQRVKGDEFRIMNDRYDHDMHPWSTSSKRNIATIALWIVNVGASPMPVHVLAMNAYHIGKDGAFGTYGFDIIFYKNIITIPKK